MPKIQYVNHRFHAEQLAMIVQANTILAEYQQQ